MSDQGQRTLKTTKKSFEIIEYLHQKGGGRLSEISDALDLTPSTTHHHLATLRETGYAIKEDNTYHLSLNFLTLGGEVRTRKKTYRKAMEKANELAHKTGERTQFIVEENGKGVWIIRVLGSDAVLADVRIGMREHLHTTAAGKCILAHLPDGYREEIFNEYDFPSRTEHTITDREELSEALSEVRRRGYAINKGERIKREQAIGVPILSLKDEVIGGLSVTAPSYRWNKKDLDEKLPEILLEAKNELELDIAYK